MPRREPKTITMLAELCCKLSFSLFTGPQNRAGVPVAEVNRSTQKHEDVTGRGSTGNAVKNKEKGCVETNY